MKNLSRLVCLLLVTGASSVSDSNELRAKDSPRLIWTSLTGYMSSSVSSLGSKEQNEYGLSFYTAIWSTFPKAQTHNYQMGHGTWITPDNSTYNKPLCPKGTFAKDNWPERGPSYRDVFQTIEGGPGYWGNTRFPSLM